MNIEGAAFIERGIVLEVCKGGYRVQSLTRDGVITPAMPAVDSEAEYAVGNRVYFFMFDDGHGAVIMAF